MMKIVGAHWTMKYNILYIDCSCGFRILHRADRWKVKCSMCGATGNLKQLREVYCENNIPVKHTEKLMVRRIERSQYGMRIKKKVIFCDDREKDGWNSDYLGPGFEVVRKRLDTGDYTIKGMEHLVCIEKKASWQEIAMNIGSKKNLENFKKELERMGDFPIRMLVIHEDPSHIYHTRTYAKHIGKNTLILWYMRIQLEYGIPVMCVGNKAIAKNMIRIMFKKIIEFHEQGRLHYHGANQNELFQ